MTLCANGIKSESGFSLVGLMVAMAIGTIILAMISKSFFDIVRQLHNEGIMAETEYQNQSLREFMTSEVRSIGSGVPLGLPGFLPGSPGLGNAPLSILLNSDQDSLTIRHQSKEMLYTLSSDFTPTIVNRTFSLVSLDDLSEGDEIYISNMPSDGNSGLYGIVQAISGSNVTIDSSYIATAAAVFPSGSVLTVIETVTYESPPDQSGIQRTTTAGTVNLGPGTAFTLEYLDQDGNTIAMPLTDSVVENNLSSIRVSVSVTASKLLKNGDGFAADSSQIVALKNLILGRTS